MLLAPGDTLRADALNLPAGGEAGDEAGGGVSVPDGLTLAEIEKRVLEQVLARCQGNRTLTAEKLGLSRRTIQRKIKEHSLPY